MLSVCFFWNPGNTSRFTFSMEAANKSQLFKVSRHCYSFATNNYQFWHDGSRVNWKIPYFPHWVKFERAKKVSSIHYPTKFGEFPLLFGTKPRSLARARPSVNVNSETRESKQNKLGISNHFWSSRAASERVMWVGKMSTSTRPGSSAPALQKSSAVRMSKSLIEAKETKDTKATSVGGTKPSGTGGHDHPGSPSVRWSGLKGHSTSSSDIFCCFSLSKSCVVSYS